MLHSYTVTQLAAVTQPRIFSPRRSGRSTRHPLLHLLHLLHLHHPDGHPQDSPCKNCNCHEPGDTCDRYKIHNTMTTYKINTILLPDRYRDTEVILSLAGSCCLLKLAMGRVAFEGNFIHLQICCKFDLHLNLASIFCLYLYTLYTVHYPSYILSYISCYTHYIHYILLFFLA